MSNQISRGGPPRVTARRAATRDRLVAAAEDVFADRGFHGASVEDICEQAGFTRGAFYSNFATKDELVLEIASRYSQRLLDAIARIADRVELSPAEIIAAVMAEWSADRTSREKWYLLQAEFTMHAIRDRGARTSWARHQAEVRQGLAALISDISARRGIELTVDAEDLARVAMALYLSSTGQHLLEPRRLRDGDLVRRFLPMLVEASSR